MNENCTENINYRGDSGKQAESVFLKFHQDIERKKEKELLKELTEIRSKFGTKNKKFLELRNYLSSIYIKFIIQKAWKSYYKSEEMVLFEDFLSQGYLGILEALERFDGTSFDNEFLTYGDFYITKYMKDLTLGNMGISHSIYEQYIKVMKEATRRDIDLKELRAIDFKIFLKNALEIKGENKLLEKVFILRPLITGHHFSISLDQPSNLQDGEEGRSLIDTLASSEDFFKDYSEAGYKTFLVDEIFKIVLNMFKFNDKYLNIFKMRFNYLNQFEIEELAKQYDGTIPPLKEDRTGYTLQEIGDVFGVTRERIRQIEKLMLTELKSNSKLSKLINI